MPVYALVDCNAFYCSCEAVFDARLRNQALVVLSNNDGCVIARNAQAKLAGVKMGEPWFKIAGWAKRHGVMARSSNYELYGDMSQRVIEVLRQFTPELEVYSIDECFLKLDGCATHYLEYGQQICSRIFRWTGIPVGVGIASTKTLAKFANHLAKKHPLFSRQHVCDLTTLAPAKLDALLAKTPVGDVWGIGRRLAEKMNALRISTAYDLKQASARAMKRKFSVTVEKIILELNGISCLDLKTIPEPRQQIIVSRGFGQPVYSLEELREAVSLYALRACEKMRAENTVASAVAVFIHTNRHAPDAYYYGTHTLPLIMPSADSRHIVNACLAALNMIYQPRFKYSKAGVLLIDLKNKQYRQADMFCADPHPATDSDSENLMRTVDRVNKKMGKPMLILGSAIGSQAWMMRRQWQSPRFTTSWDELLEVKAC